MHALTHPGCVANGAAFGGLVLMRFPVESEFLDTVGIPDSRTEIVMLRPPD